MTSYWRALDPAIEVTRDWRALVVARRSTEYLFLRETQGRQICLTNPVRLAQC
jgi:hypothetical protein